MIRHRLLFRSLTWLLLAALAAPVTALAQDATCPYAWLCVGSRANDQLPLPHDAQALGAQSIGISGSARTNGSIAIGAGSLAGYNMANNDDPNGWAANQYAVALGAGSSALSTQSLALGAESNASSAYDVALGAQAQTSNNGNQRKTALGAFSVAAGALSTAVGAQSAATGNNSFAGGANSSASATSAIALLGQASAEASMAFGTGAVSSAAFATAVGQGASATAERATAIGTGSLADQANTISFGTDANARRLTHVAQGQANTDAVNVQQLTDAIKTVSVAGVPWIASSDVLTPASAQGAKSTSIGAGANAMGTGSVALGNGSAATEDNTVSLGNATTGVTRRLVNLSDGIAPSDGVTMRQAQNITATFGGGASLYNDLAPTYVFTSPGAAGTYNDVGTALNALDNGLNAVNQRVDNLPPGNGGATGSQGAQGPKGDKGDTGAVGAQGPAGQGNGRDELAVHYDDTTQQSVTLSSTGTTAIHGVKAGVSGTDAANVSQVNQALTSAKSYADEGDQRTLNWANQYTDQRLRGMNRRIDQAGAVGSVFGQMALSAGAIPQQDKISMGLASYRGASAIGIGYTHRFENDRVAVAFGGAFAGSGSALGVSVSIGLGE